MKNQLHKTTARTGFTLVEILVVISIIALLAGLVVATAVGVVNKSKIQRTQTELKQIETAIETYKARKGFYPPDNPNPNANYKTNALFYELVGTKLGPGNRFIPNITFTVADANGVLAAILQANCGVGGIANSSRGAGDDDVAGSEIFLKGVTEKQAQLTQPNANGFRLLIAPVNDEKYDDFNPWRYNSSNPKHNPGSYDLWAVVSVGGKTNIVCNWSDKPLVTTNLYP